MSDAPMTSEPGGKDIIEELRRASGLLDIDLKDSLAGRIIAEIECLRAVVEQCRAAGFLDDAGNVRKVLGQLPLTADGAIIGSGGEVWQEDANWESQKRPRFYFRALYSANTSERTPRYSTLAAAEAAKGTEK